MTLMLTPDAAQVIKGLADIPGAAGLRISPMAQPPDTEGPGLQVELAAGPEPQDAVVDVEGVQIFLAPEAAETMEDKVLDADIHGEQVRFAVLQQTEEPPGG